MEKVKAVVGIDIGGTNTTFGFVDRSGKIMAEDHIITTTAFTFSIFRNRVC